MEDWLGTTSSGVVGLAAAVLTIAAAFPFAFPRGRLSVCWRLWLGLLRPRLLPGGCHFRLRGILRYQLRSRFRLWRWSGGGLDNTLPSDDVIPPLAQVRLLHRGPGPLCFRSGGLACGGALPDTFWRSLCKGCLRFFPLNTAPVTRCVVAPAATAQAVPAGLSTHR